MVNTNMFEFKHPKYYKELRSIRNKLDQAISKEPATAGDQRSPGPGLKPQATSSEPQAASNKHQAASVKLQATSSEISSDKHQASSNKPQASSRKQQAAR